MAEARVTRGEAYLRRLQAVCERIIDRGESPSEQQLKALNELQGMQLEFLADRERLSVELARQAASPPRPE